MITITRTSHQSNELLFKKPTVNHLLTVIATKAITEDCINGPLKAGQCVINNCHEIGLNASEYRAAKKLLTSMGLATFSGTARVGTVATLLDSDIYSITSNKRTTVKLDNSKPTSKTAKIKSVLNELDQEALLNEWNKSGCKRHTKVTDKAAWSISRSYDKYCESRKGQSSVKSINEWVLVYLSKGFSKIMTDHHRELCDGSWSADLEFAFRPDTYDRVSSTAR